MHKIINLIGKIVCYGLIAIGAVLCMLIIMKSGVITTDVKVQNALVVPGVIIAIVATLLCVCVAVIFPMFFATYTKKSLISAGIVALIAIVLLGIAWIMPDAKLSADYIEEMKITEGISKWVGVGCYLVYFTLAGAVIAIVYAAVMDLIKSKL